MLVPGVGLSRAWLAAAVVAVCATATGGGAAPGDLTFGARQVTCPRDAQRDLPESTRIACWSYDREALLPALRRAARTGEHLRVDLLRDRHLSVRITYDEGSDGWHGKGPRDTDLVLVLGDGGEVAFANASAPGERYEARELDEHTYVVGKVWRYAVTDPNTPPMTSPPVVETPPARSASPTARPARSAAATAAPPRSPRPPVATPPPRSRPATFPAVTARATTPPAVLAAPALPVPPRERPPLALVAVAAAAVAAIVSGVLRLLRRRAA